jgi:UDPglucose 6-dehydrogenase
VIKYAENAFQSIKFSFINEMANVREALGADVIDLLKAVGLDGRIGRKFLHPAPGYGGSCFPKNARIA